MDQHVGRVAAPRPVYIASAVEDRWADPYGEFLSGLHANPVYQLYNRQECLQLQPAVDQPVMGTIGYHVRTGKHDVTDFDWEQYLKFADKHLNAKVMVFRQKIHTLTLSLRLPVVTKTYKMRHLI